MGPKKKRTSEVMLDSDDDSDFEDVPNFTPVIQVPKKRKSKKKLDVNANSSEWSEKRPLIKNNNNNIVKSLDDLYRGIRNSVEEKLRISIVEQFLDFEVYKSVTAFDRRVTALAWHPKETSVCAAGSKGGDILVWNYFKSREFEYFHRGIGAGGSIQNMKFDPENSSRLYTCSIDGTFALKDLTLKSRNRNLKVYQDTGDWERWYTAFDVNFSGKMIIAGDNKGNVTLMTSSEDVWKKRLHGGKVTNIEFSPREPWLLVTTSVEHNVKIWDIRNISDKKSFLQELPHEKAVNSAYFNSVDGTRLVTTDQHSELRIYRGPNWNLERILAHPHRQFQHLTPIRATWHPLVDLVVVGRYPDEKFPGFVEGESRSVDFIDPDSGETVFQLTQRGMNTIVNLNRFSPTGDALLSGSASSVLIWKRKFRDDKNEYAEKDTNVKDLKIQEWPSFEGKKTKTKSKKLKKIVDE